MISKRLATAPERFFTRSPFSIVTMVARIKGRITEDMLKHALRKVQQQHYLLQVSISEDQNHDLWFTPTENTEIPLRVISRQSSQDWIEVHTEALKIPFDFTQGPPIRIILIQAEDVSEMIIICHHIICDGMSLAFLARDILKHLGDPGLETEALHIPAPLSLDNLPDDVSQSGLVKFIIKRMNRKWEKDKVLFDQQDYETINEAYWKNFHHKFVSIELTEEETAKLVRRCKEEEVTVNSALTTAMSAAQNRVEGEQDYHERIVIAASVRDRLPQSPGEGMGMYAGGVDLKYKYDPQQSFWQNSRAFQTKFRKLYKNSELFKDILNWMYLDATLFEAMHYKKLGNFIPENAPRHEKLSAFSRQKDVVLSILQRDNYETMDKKLWGTAVTNLGRLDIPTQYGDLELDRLIMQPGGGVPLANVNLVIGAATCNGKLSIILEYAEEAVSTEVVEKIKDRAMVFLFA